ncbi:hypothetical protein Tco_0109253 [Tanacetum coccineum]
MKAKALKEQTTTSRPTKALTVYSPNTPATLFPRVLPTKSQVKINIFALIQLFSDFEKTCNKRITPTRLTERERGFEQTKACYLIEVIPFFKTLKEHFEGIQKALTKEVKEMKEIFEELEAEVYQHVVDRKHDEIERKMFLALNTYLEFMMKLKRPNTKASKIRNSDAYYYDQKSIACGSEGHNNQQEGNTLSHNKDDKRITVDDDHNES